MKTVPRITLAAAALVVVALPAAVGAAQTATAPASAPASAPAGTAVSLDALWERLAEADTARGRQAIWDLLENPSSGEFLGKKLACPAADQQKVKRLIADLDAAAYATRKKAIDELARLECAAQAALEEAEKSAASAEAKVNIAELLEVCQRPLFATPASRQIVRAIWALELIGPAGRGELERLSRGDDRRRATMLARTVLPKPSSTGWKPVPPEPSSTGSKSVPQELGDYLPKLRYDVKVLTAQIKVDGAVQLEARLINEGKVPAAVYWGDFAYEDMYRFAITGEDGAKLPPLGIKLCPPDNAPEPRYFIELPPGRDVKYNMFLSEIGANCQTWYFRRPGKYTIEPSLTVATVNCYDPAAAEIRPVPGAWTGGLKAPAVKFEVAGDAAELDKGVGIDGLVTDPSGKPVGGARVTIREQRAVTGMRGGSMDGLDTRTIEIVLTGADGRFSCLRLPADSSSFLLEAVHDDWPEARVSLTHEPPKIRYEAKIAFAPGITVRGKVVDPAGRPLAGARLDRGERHRFSGPDGRFAFTVPAELHEGNVWFGVWKRGYVGGQQRVPPEKAASGDLVLVLPTEAQMSITGRAVFADGGSVAGVWFTLSLKDEAGKPLSATGRTDADGHFRAVLGRPGQFDGLFVVDLQRDNIGIARTHWITPVAGLAPGQKDLKVILDNSAAIAVQVRPSNPLPEKMKFRVDCEMLAPPDNRRQIVAQAEIPATGGQTEFKDLSCGTYTVKVTVATADDWTWSHEVVIDPKTDSHRADVDFALPPLLLGAAKARFVESDGKTPVKSGMVYCSRGGSSAQGQIVNGLLELKDAPVGKFYGETTMKEYVRTIFSGEIRSGETTDLGTVIVCRLEEVTGLVEGTLRYDDGTPVVGAALHEWHGAYRQGPMGPSSLVDADGKYPQARLFEGQSMLVFDLKAASGWPASKVKLDKPYGAPFIAEFLFAPVDVTPGRTITRDVTLPRGKLVTLPVTFKGREEVGLSVKIIVDLGQAKLVRTWFDTRAVEGPIQMANLPAGPMVVQLIAAGAGYRGCKAIAADKLAEGVSFDPADAGTIVVKLPKGQVATESRAGVTAYPAALAWLEEPVRGPHSSFFPIPGWGVEPGKSAPTHKVLDDGTVVLLGLAPGKYLVQRDDGESGKAVEVQVQAGKEALVQLPEDDKARTQPATSTKPGT